MKKKIIILGAGTFQKGLILYLKQEGFFTIAITNKPNEFSAQIADQVIPISYMEVSKVDEIMKQENGVQIFSVGSDAALPTQTTLQELYKLSGNSKKTVLFFATKWNYKKLLAKTKLGPKASLVNTPKELLTILTKEKKHILKPISGSGSSGVQKINNTQDINTLNFESSKKYIVEEYIQGKELGCELFIFQNTIYYAFITHKSTNNFGVPDGHLILKYFDKQPVLHFLQEIKEVLQLQEGFYNLDIMSTEDQYYLLDISPRLGGNCIPEVIKHGYGVDEYEYLTKWLLRKAFSTPVYTFKKNVGVYIIGSREKGILSEIKEKNHPFKQYEIELFWNKKVGDSVAVFDQGSHHLGYFIFTASSDTEIVELFDKVKNYQWFVLQKNEIPVR